MKTLGAEPELVRQSIIDQALAELDHHRPAEDGGPIPA